MAIPSWLPLGLAIQDYHKQGHASHLLVHTREGTVTPYPVEMFFRDYEDFGIFDELGCAHARDKVLDIGAGAGCISLFLQDGMGLDVTAVEISPDAVEVMRQRGVRDARAIDFFDLSEGKWDTLLLMMNGIGFVGTLDGYEAFLAKASTLLEDGGQILFDSSDLELTELNPADFRSPDSKYPGEVWYQLEYKGIRGQPYQWLYLDAKTARTHAEKAGFKFEMLQEAEDGYYLARLTKKVPEKSRP